MRPGLLTLSAALIGGLSLSAVAAAKDTATAGPGSRGRGPGMMFDPATITTVAGHVTAVERFDRGPVQALSLLVEASEGNVTVVLGPSWYLDQQSVKLAKGDAVEVTGSRVVFEGKSMIVAQTVTSGDRTITLRDATGLPAWRGQTTGPGPGTMGRGPAR